MAAPLTLKIKAGNQHSVIKDLTSNSSLSDLAQKVSSFSGIPESRLKLCSGFPPKALEMEVKTKSLHDSGIKSGDVILAQETQETTHTKNESASTATIDQTVRAIDQSEIISAYSAAQANGGGFLLRKVVPSDNSCLFTSIGYVLNDPDKAQFMRQIIVEKVRSDPEIYNEAFLEKPASDYCSWIQKPEAWGGAIEVSILSSFYGFEIVVVNSLHGIVNRFGEDQKYATRAFLIYDGIHYDPLYLEPYDGGAIKMIFPTTDEEVLDQARVLAQESKSSRQFTNVHEFTVKCLECQILLKGEIAARAHAKETDHVRFGEV
ncbi:ubiquitin thioesterase Otu1 isoform X2 [Cloeon dipterum]|uniref:ubiquitin thioesterase Otu1 isoform X2 n=1 Tax=Cloeon dipterum TaxID=197152 RepID=UPI0032203563